ncbi:MAG TPA: pyridoxine 5'-phosphate synthase [Candidatus Limnocylindria bacterium]|jgi:pyridoxine 5-phosphate synthase|nr:pyridoxine 5'-phosphate synthase [Candidatus Limnocylindria bacterium]
MLKLGVNIDHVATLREARYRGSARGEPNPLQAALACERAGAHGITIHLREDRRHILDRDVREVRAGIQTRLNFEMANIPEMLAIACATKPNTVCLVPERRQELTTEGGLDVIANEAEIRTSTVVLNQAGVEVSLFIGPDLAQIEAAARTGAQFIELHTGAFAEEFRQDGEGLRELTRLVEGARRASALGLRINAGHGITTSNVKNLFAIPHLEELNIGHSIVSRAVFVGLESAVKEMLAAMDGYPGA